MEAKSTLELDDDAMRTLVTRLGRPHRSGGRVIERATLLASGTDFSAAVRWIEAHGGRPEGPVDTSSQHGLHGTRTSGGPAPAPLRFVLPPDA